jgi:hypothetical protein
VAVAFGMDPEAAMIYLADHVGPPACHKPHRRPSIGHILRLALVAGLISYDGPG